MTVGHKPNNLLLLLLLLLDGSNPKEPLIKEIP